MTHQHCVHEWHSFAKLSCDQVRNMYLVMEAILQPSLFWLNLVAIPYATTGGSRSFNTTIVLTICLNMNALLSMHL